MLIILERNIYIPHDDRTKTMGGSTLGTLWIPDMDFNCWAVERPWENNKPWVSCIPEGFYRLKYTEGLSKKGAQWVVQDVPNRSAIEFHVANRSSELAGCIALGKTLYMFNKELGVSQSTATTARFNETLKPLRGIGANLLITKGTMS